MFLTRERLHPGEASIIFPDKLELHVKFIAVVLIVTGVRLMSNVWLRIRMDLPAPGSH